MLQELFNNRNEILKNYLDIIYINRKWILMILVVILLCLVYAFLCVKEYQQNEIGKQSREVINNLEGFTNLNRETNSITNINNMKTNEVEEKSNVLKFITSMNTENKIEKNYLDNLLQWIKKEYLSKMNSVNITARNFDSISEISSKYNKELLSPINPEEIIIVQEFIKKNKDKYISESKKNIWFDNILQKTVITKGQSWLEMGMPHTHTNVIIFGSGWFNNPSWKTFIHECVHTDQRIGVGMTLYKKLYTMWGFEYYDIKKIKGMEGIVTRNRHNPDAIDCNWVWNCPIDGNTYWIGAVFDSITPESLGDVSYIGIKLEKDSNGSNLYYNGSDMRQLYNWKVFNDYFVINSNEYHPNEIVAEYMSIYFMINDSILDSNSSSRVSSNVIKLNNSKGFKIFKEWFNNDI
jgi:hypothetical protein